MSVCLSMSIPYKLHHTVHFHFKILGTLGKQKSSNYFYILISFYNIINLVNHFLKTQCYASSQHAATMP